MADSVNLCSLIEQFGGNEDKCREYLEMLRWAGEIECPRCGHEQVTKIANRAQYYCISCHYNFSVTAGTIFNDSHLDLWKWFLATYLLCESRKGMSANQIKRMVGVSYKTAWYLCHRIRAAMKEVCPDPLSGTVEMDETWVGGKEYNPRGDGRLPYAESKKVPVIGIKQRGGELRFFKAEDCKSGTLARYIRENVSGDVDVIMTDDWNAYPAAMVDAGVGISAKHLEAYLAEMTFRFNNRNNPYLFRDTLMKLIEAPKLEYKELTAA